MHVKITYKIHWDIIPLGVEGEFF